MDLSFHYADLPNGMRLHYAQAGQGSPILFVHGFPEFWYAWKDQLLEFGADHCAVALDMRGYNLSSKPADVRQYRARYLVEDIKLLTEHLGWGRFTLVAHDWGGAVAWNFAAAYPERLGKLIVINAPHPVTFARELRDNPAQQQASRYMNLFREQRADALLSEEGYRRLTAMTLDAWAKNGGAAAQADRAAYLVSWAQPGAVTGALNYYRASPLHPPTAENPNTVEMDPKLFYVTVPTLVIWGEKDEALLTGNLAGLEDHVRTLEVARISNGSHWVVHEHPARVNALIRQQLTES
ncbi:MAG: alpha/beta hydrolase [Betaproteobacteria bacterium]|nr:alpha/beta hydrolase [Betaproteobacteria bacterium]